MYAYLCNDLVVSKLSAIFGLSEFKMAHCQLDSEKTFSILNGL